MYNKFNIPVSLLEAANKVFSEAETFRVGLHGKKGSRTITVRASSGPDAKEKAKARHPGADVVSAERLRENVASYYHELERMTLQQLDEHIEGSELNEGIIGNFLNKHIPGTGHKQKQEKLIAALNQRKASGERVAALADKKLPETEAAAQKTAYAFDKVRERAAAIRKASTKASAGKVSKKPLKGEEGLTDAQRVDLARDKVQTRINKYNDDYSKAGAAHTGATTRHTDFVNMKSQGIVKSIVANRRIGQATTGKHKLLGNPGSVLDDIKRSNKLHNRTKTPAYKTGPSGPATRVAESVVSILETFDDLTPLLQYISEDSYTTLLDTGSILKEDAEGLATFLNEHYEEPMRYNPEHGLVGSGATGRRMPVGASDWHILQHDHVNGKREVISSINHAEKAHQYVHDLNKEHEGHERSPSTGIKGHFSVVRPMAKFISNHKRNGLTSNGDTNIVAHGGQEIRIPAEHMKAIKKMKDGDEYHYDSPTAGRVHVHAANGSHLHTPADRSKHTIEVPHRKDLSFYPKKPLTEETQIDELSDGLKKSYLHSAVRDVIDRANEHGRGEDPAPRGVRPKASTLNTQNKRFDKIISRQRFIGKVVNSLGNKKD